MLPDMNSRMSCVEAGPALGEQGDRRHDLPRRAVAALESVVPDERQLQRMRRTAGRETLDGGHLAAFARCGERQAGQHPLAVRQHRARATGSLVTALLGAGEADMVTQRVEQGHPGVHHQTS